jgi:catechol 2,3-dioxygenase-like lactoylglutathione lyase family enzyme
MGKIQEAAVRSMRNTADIYTAVRSSGQQVDKGEEWAMDWKLEVIPVPVSDVDRAKSFYADMAGFKVDLDVEIGGGNRMVQLTPPGSACSIHLNTALNVPAGILEGLILVVDDIDAARSELVGRGVEVSPVRHMENGEWVDGKGGRWNSFVFFNDPDGNGWVVQERPAEGE